MRIIAGKHKGRQLKVPEGEHVRPTSDMVRQALFTKLQFFVPEKRVLDLFAGSGAIGIEAISRGASEVVFVDDNALSIKCIKENLAKINCNAVVLHSNFATACKRLNGKQYDLIYLDPPYKANLYHNALQCVADNLLLATNGVVVCEHLVGNEITHPLFNMYDQKKYGSKMLTYYENINDKEV